MIAPAAKAAGIEPSSRDPESSIQDATSRNNVRVWLMNEADMAISQGDVAISRIATLAVPVVETR